MGQTHATKNAARSERRIIRRQNSSQRWRGKAKPGLLIVYHAWVSWWPEVAPSDRPVVLTTDELHSTPDVLQKEIGSRYAGTFIIGSDLSLRSSRRGANYNCRRRWYCRHRRRVYFPC